MDGLHNPGPTPARPQPPATPAAPAAAAPGPAEGKEARLLAVLGRSAILRGLPTETLKALVSQLQLVRLQPEEYLFFQLDPADALYVVEQGRLRVFRTTPDGRERTLAHLAAGDVIGELALLDGLPRSASVQAIEPCALWRLDRRAFVSLLSRDSRLAMGIIQLLARRLRETNRQLEEAAAGPVPDRLVRVLKRLALAAGAPTNDAPQKLRVTQQELANLTGTTRESVNRGLSRLEAQGLVLRRSRGTLWIHRRRLLAAVPEEDPTA